MFIVKKHADNEKMLKGVKIKLAKRKTKHDCILKIKKQNSIVSDKIKFVFSNSIVYRGKYGETGQKFTGRDGRNALINFPKLGCQGFLVVLEKVPDHSNIRH